MSFIELDGRVVLTVSSRLRGLGSIPLRDFLTQSELIEHVLPKVTARHFFLSQRTVRDLIKEDRRIKGPAHGEIRTLDLMAMRCELCRCATTVTS